jgi:hypothetical protein
LLNRQCSFRANSKLETCIGLLPSTEDQTEANRKTLADFAGPISVELAITHSNSIVQMRLCCLKGHLLANLSSYCKCLQDGPSRVRSEPQCLAAILDQINFNYRPSTGGRATLYISFAI